METRKTVENMEDTDGFQEKQIFWLDWMGKRSLKHNYKRKWKHYTPRCRILRDHKRPLGFSMDTQLYPKKLGSKLKWVKSWKCTVVIITSWEKILVDQ